MFVSFSLTNAHFTNQKPLIGAPANASLTPTMFRHEFVPHAAWAADLVGDYFSDIIECW